MSRIRTVFLGTPSFAARILEALLDDEHLEIVGVVTQPDKPRGRGLKLSPSPVKVQAMKAQIPVLTPAKASSPESLEQIHPWKAELAIVVAYGQILSEKFLNMFHYGAVNVHASLLPRWRGAAPIQRAIENGETETGVTLQKMVKELDAGDIIGVRHLNIDVNDTALEILERCLPLSIQLLQVDLMDYVRGNLTPYPQDSSQVTYAHKISKEEAKLNWSFSAWSIHNKIRAFTMGPGTYTLLARDQSRIKILRSHWHDLKTIEVFSPQDPPGTFKIHQNRVWVKCGPDLGQTNKPDFFEIKLVQPQDRSAIEAKVWADSLNLPDKKGYFVSLV